MCEARGLLRPLVESGVSLFAVDEANCVSQVRCRVSYEQGSPVGVIDNSSVQRHFSNRPFDQVRCRANTAHIRQSRPDSGTYKTVKARFRHIQDSQGQILAHIRQSRPDSGTHKTVTVRWRSSHTLSSSASIKAGPKSALPFCQTHRSQKLTADRFLSTWGDAGYV